MINTKVLSSDNKIKTGLYKTTTHCFYMQSKLFEAQITTLFDDLWVMVTSLKNLRWQVNGYYHVNNCQNNSKLVSRFVDAEDITNRPNLYRSCISRQWEQWDDSLSQIFLTNMFALFEGWLEIIVDQIFIGTENKKKELKKWLQFPDKYRTGLHEICQGGNMIIINAFYDVYKFKNKHYNFAHLENYLKLYRYFKECRNCIIHKGGVSNQKLVDAYNAIALLTASDIDVNEMPKIESITTQGAPVKLYLRGVVGFSQVLLKIVSTFDIEFIKCNNNETLFFDTIKEYNSNKPAINMNINALLSKKVEVVKTICNRAHFNKPNYSEDLYNMFKGIRLIF